MSNNTFLIPENILSLHRHVITISSHVFNYLGPVGFYFPYVQIDFERATGHSFPFITLTNGDNVLPNVATGPC